MDDAYAQLIKPITKYVASQMISQPLTWNSHLLGPDLAKEVAALKDHCPGDLIVYGCGQLANDLARSGVVGEVRFWLQHMCYVEGCFDVRQPGNYRPVVGADVPKRDNRHRLRRRIGHQADHAISTPRAASNCLTCCRQDEAIAAPMTKPAVL